MMRDPGHFTCSSRPGPSLCEGRAIHRGSIWFVWFIWFVSFPEPKKLNVSIFLRTIPVVGSSAGKLPTSAPADEQSAPSTAAMMNSNSHRLCEVGSFAVSTATRASIGAATAPPTARITARRRALPNARAAAARTPTTIRPVLYKVFGSETFA